VRDIAIPDPEAALAELTALAADTAKKSSGLFSPLKIIEAVRASVANCRLTKAWRWSAVCSWPASTARNAPA
jgi:hypothetical protein